MSLELFCEKFSLPVVNDLVKTMLGRELGHGVYRTVFECALSPSLVLKINNPDIDPNFANANEWAVWMAVSETSFKRWFAPCKDVSYGGMVLVQEKTMPVGLDELKAELPRVPAFFTDLKVGNWGRYKGQIVCHDYGTHLMLERGMSKAMRKADWWE